MIHVIRAVRLQSQPCLRLEWNSSIRREKTGVRFQQARVESTAKGERALGGGDGETKATSEDRRDVMGDSFGEGYSTRSDEEGFGGTFGANQKFSKEEENISSREKHAEFDKSQGSDVKEKEKGRHQHDKMTSS